MPRQPCQHLNDVAEQVLKTEGPGSGQRSLPARLHSPPEFAQRSPAPDRYAPRCFAAVQSRAQPSSQPPYPP